MQNSELSLLSILNILHDHEVDFIIVGGVSAVLQGAPMMTFDVDVVHSRTDENIERLMRALEVMDARYRGRANIIKPNPEYLKSKGHHLLATCFGPLDLLGTIEHHSEYKGLIGHTDDIELDHRTFHVLRLEYLVELKKDSVAEKDRLKMPILIQTLKEKQCKKRTSGLNRDSPD